jgi:hypothetical protein
MSSQRHGRPEPISAAKRSVRNKRLATDNGQGEQLPEVIAGLTSQALRGSDAIAVEVGSFGGAIAVSLGAVSGAIAATGVVAVLASATAVIGALAVAVSASGLLLRRWAWRTRPLAIGLLVMSVFVGAGSALVATAQKRAHSQASDQPIRAIRTTSKRRSLSPHSTAISTSTPRAPTALGRRPGRSRPLTRGWPAKTSSAGSAGDTALDTGVYDFLAAKRLILVKTNAPVRLGLPRCGRAYD